MKILLTGASGFLGSIIQDVLKDHQIHTLGRKSSVIHCDLKSDIPVLSNYDFIVHSAGKAHEVPKSNRESQDFFDVNVTGTCNLLKGLNSLSLLPKCFVFISSVSVYGRAQGSLFNEDTSLEATDPYGLSKIQAEEVVQEWCLKNNMMCAILRLPLIAGPNPPGNLKSMIEGVKRGFYFNIDGGRARKSMVLATDIANIIPKVAEIGGVYNLTDGYHPSFAELSELIANQLGKEKPRNISYELANTLAIVGDLFGSKLPINSDKLKKITSSLTFDDIKARRILGWQPHRVLESFKIS